MNPSKRSHLFVHEKKTNLLLLAIKMLLVLAGPLPYKKFWSNHRGETHKLLVLHLPPVKARVKEGTLLPKTECFHAKTI